MQNTYHVYFPSQSQQLIIDTVARYVSTYGQAFENELIEKLLHSGDAKYNFLVNSGTPENVFYKWRVYSLCQGDTLDHWNTNPYWIFNGGSKWIPPPITHKSSNEKDLKNKNLVKSAERGGKTLPTESQQLLIDKIAKLSSKRSSIRDAMIYIIDHCDYALKVSNILIDSIIDTCVDVSTKILRMYLLHDVLYNSSCSKPLSWIYITSFESRLPEIFNHFSKLAFKSGKISRGLIIGKLYNLVKIWESWAIYSGILIKALKFTILSDYVDTILQPIQLPTNLLNLSLDGNQLKESEILFKLPLPYRKFAYKYVHLSLDQLKSNCLQLGLFTGGTNEELLLRLAAFEYYYSNVDKQSIALSVFKPRNLNVKNSTLSDNKSSSQQISQLHGSDTLLKIDSSSENSEQKVISAVESIEINQNFEESDMEVMSD